MPDLSVVIIAQDEQRTIADVLKAVKPIAGEIILVDSGSTDCTVAVAESFEVKVFHQEWLGYSAQKNYALSLASGQWLLSLDADEIVTPLLAAEIQKTLSGPVGERFDGFTIPRILYIGDRAITHGGFYPDAQLRLFRAGKGRFKDRLVHEAVTVEGRVGRLTQPLKHMAYKSVEEFKQAMDKYARLSAAETQRRPRNWWRAHPVNEALHPVWTFFYRYLVRGGFLDGAMGLRLNLIYSDYVRRKIRYLRNP